MSASALARLCIVLACAVIVPTLPQAAAAEPALPQTNSNKDLTDGWIIGGGAPGVDTCVARLPGAEVDTMLMLNKDGDLLLVAGREDWQQPAGNWDISVQVDDVEIEHVKATVFNNLVFLLVKDESTVHRLRAAKVIAWYLPVGVYRASVAGLGSALDSLRMCEQTRAATLGH